jgi:hypothetical protein
VDGEWGYCRYCAYEVATEYGVMLKHERYAGSYEKLECPGSNRKATEQPAPECQPIRLVKLTKNLTQINSRKAKRDHLIRQRAARQRAESVEQNEGIILGNPSEVILTNPETGERVDITDAIVGPIRINLEHPDREAPHGDFTD